MCQGVRGEEVGFEGGYGEHMSMFGILATFRTLRRQICHAG